MACMAESQLAKRNKNERWLYAIVVNQAQYEVNHEMMREEKFMKTWFQAMLLAGCLVIATQALAQQSIGVMGGFNITNLIRDPSLAGTSHEFRTRSAFGATVDFKVAGGLVLTVEPLLAFKGARFDSISSVDESFHTRQINLSYLELPVLLKYRLSPSLNGLYFVGGPSFALLLSAKEKERIVSVDIKDQRESIDIGLTGGAGIVLSAEKFNFFFEGRYNYGLTNINKSSGDDSTLRNNGLLLFWGLLFPL